MDRATVHALLQSVASGSTTVGDALERLAVSGDVHLEFATVDTGRAARIGAAEVVYGENKSAEQVAAILAVLVGRGQLGLATRIDVEKGALIVASVGGDARYNALARTVVVGPLPEPSGRVAVVSAGTSDEPVAAEAALVAQVLGCGVVRVNDVGVAGLHRILAKLPELRECSCVVVVAGMDGALPSVVGGLVSVPVIAVPTSVGYGASLGGIAALLTMLNSCAPGVVVVNIDNGFGAGFAAARVNRAILAENSR